MFTTLRYMGVNRRKITWNSMGQCFSYTVSPGEPVDIPTSQVNNAKAVAVLVEVEDKKRKHGRVRKIRKIIEGESSEVVTESDEAVFQKQDRLDPFANVEASGQEVEIEIEEDEETKDVEILKEEEEEVAEQDEVVVEEDDEESEDGNTDFASKNKKELAAYLIDNNKELKEYVLLKERKDTLIAMCVDLEASL